MTKRLTIGFAAYCSGSRRRLPPGRRKSGDRAGARRTNDAITVEKDKDKWEIARTKDTKVTGDLKKGARVTIKYTMTAASVEVKDAGKGEEKKRRRSSESEGEALNGDG